MFVFNLVFLIVHIWYMYSQIWIKPLLIWWSQKRNSNKWDKEEKTDLVNMPVNCYIIIVTICYNDYFIRSNVYILSILFHYSCLMFVDLNQATADVKESLSQNLTTERDKTTTKYDCLLNSMSPSMILFILLCFVSLILFCFFFKFISPYSKSIKQYKFLTKS